MADPIELALGGLGGPLLTPAGAPTRPWAPPGASGPILIDLSKPLGRIIVSVIEGGLLRAEVDPPNPDTYIALNQIPSRRQRAGMFCFSFWDLQTLQVMASAMRYDVVLAPNAQGMVERWNRWCLELEWIKNFSEYPNFHVDGLDIDFLPFQARGVNYGVKIGSFGMFDQMGTGKSIQIMGILFTLRALLGGRIDTIFISPTSVVGDWHAKFRRFAKIEIAVADGTPSKRKKIYEKRPEFLSISYDTFVRDAVAITSNLKAVALIPDEAQRITNRKSKAAIKLIEYSDIAQPKHRIPMSGSPIMNMPTDLWPILRLINPGLAGDAKTFEKRYTRSRPVKWERKLDAEGQMRSVPWAKEIGKDKDGKPRLWVPMKQESLNPKKPEDAKLLDELKMKIAPYYVRRLKKDVLKDLKDKRFERVDIALGKREREVYEELQTRFAEAMAGVGEEDADGQETTFFEWFIRAQQICSSLEIVQLGTESAKMDELKSFVEDYAQDQKILIFSRFHDMTKIVCRDLAAYNPLHLHGGIKQKDRQPLVDAFQEKEEHRLFVSTLKAGGVGLTLTAGTIVIRLDRWVSPAANEQAVDRAHRIGQENLVTVIDFVVQNSVEERILEILDRKLKMIASLISADDDYEKQERQVVRAIMRKSDMLKLI